MDASVVAAGVENRVETFRRVHRLGSVCLGELRLELVLLLHQGELCVSAIAHRLELDVSGVSHALRTLSDEGFVTHRTDKKSHLYRLTPRARVVESSGVLSVYFRSTDGVTLIVQMNSMRVGAKT